jgi:phosphoribosylaminoimidazole-succinocarboxamide synthase
VSELQHVYSGKVRDMYDAGDGLLLIVASDRMSAFDVVMAETIPDKGRILTAFSAFWFDHLADVVPSHLVATDVPDLPEEWVGRVQLVQRAEMLPVECIVRGRLTGSAWKEYEASGTMHGIRLPEGLQESAELPEPVFTPSTKAELGDHDENVPFSAVEERLGTDAAATLRDLTLAVYARAEGIARDRGVILADTKLEFGTAEDGTVTLGDEVLTPDSSRFWPADGWEPGHAQPSFDKQFVRDWLTSPASGWDRAGDTPPPALPEEVVERTRARYLEAYERLTGSPLAF